MPKRVTIGARPGAQAAAEDWVLSGASEPGAQLPAKATVFTARLTLDVTPQLRGRLKVSAFSQGITVADMLRALLEREFPNLDRGAE